jgi:hypothetical protein
MTSALKTLDGALKLTLMKAREFLNPKLGMSNCPTRRV